MCRSSKPASPTSVGHDIHHDLVDPLLTPPLPVDGVDSDGVDSDGDDDCDSASGCSTRNAKRGDNEKSRGGPNDGRSPPCRRAGNGADDDPEPGWRLLRRQRAVLRTCLLVASLALLTQGVDLDRRRARLRRDMLAGTLIYMVGDWGAQFLTHWKTTTTTGDEEEGGRDGKPSWTTLLGSFRMDNARFVINALVGCVWAGMANPSVYYCVEHALPGNEWKLVLAKMVVTRSILSTLGNYVTLMARRFLKQYWESRHCAERDPALRIFTSCLKSCNQDFVRILLDDLKLFPAYDVLCYSVIPKRVRPITNAAIASSWAIYMSLAGFKAQPAQQTAAKSSKSDLLDV